MLERWRQDVRHSDRLDRGGFTVLVALTVMILVTAALLTRTLSKLESVDPGLTAERLVLVDLSLPLKYADPTKHQQLLDESITRLPTESSISAVTPVNVPPFAG